MPFIKSSFKKQFYLFHLILWEGLYIWMYALIFPKSQGFVCFLIIWVKFIKVNTYLLPQFKFTSALAV